MTKSLVDDLFTAVQFLTCFPVPGNIPYQRASLARSSKFFPLVGLLLGSLASLLNRMLARHLPRTITAVVVVAFIVLLTGALHEDAIADAADGFGGGSSPEHTLQIFRDSRIGSYGATALTLVLLARVFLLASLPVDRIFGLLTAAMVLSRWSVLPLSFYLPSVPVVDGYTPDSGQGARLARIISAGTLIFGTLITLFVVSFLLRERMLAAVLLATLVTLLTGIYYRRVIGGITGDCFGTTIQLVEIAVMCTGVWIA